MNRWFIATFHPVSILKRSRIYDRGAFIAALFPFVRVLAGFCYCIGLQLARWRDFANRATFLSFFPIDHLYQDESYLTQFLTAISATVSFFFGQVRPRLHPR